MHDGDVDQELREAIRQRSLVMFEYADLIRVVEPHRYGINSAGHRMLSAWLRAGYSRSDPSGGWRNYLLSDISGLQRLDAPFVSPRAGYAEHDVRMREVYAELPVSADSPASEGPFVVREPDIAAAEAHPVEAARTQDGEIDVPDAHP